MAEHRYTAESITRQCRIGYSNTIEHARRCFGPHERGYIFDHKRQAIVESIDPNGFGLSDIEALQYGLDTDPYDDTEVFWLLHALPVSRVAELAAQVDVHPQAEC